MVTHKKADKSSVLASKESKPNDSSKTSDFQTKVPENPKSSHHSSLSTEHSSFGSKRGPTTRIIVKYDVGFSNAIYLRGEGANLSWNKGIMLKNIKADEWLWETNIPFTKCEFKALINDRQYEFGENHKLQCGTSFEYTPAFHIL